MAPVGKKLFQYGMNDWKSEVMPGNFFFSEKSCFQRFRARVKIQVIECGAIKHVDLADMHNVIDGVEIAKG